MFVNQSPKQLLRAISSFFSIISNSLNRRSIHNNRLIFLRKCPAASPAILPAVSTGSTFEIVALITKRLPVYRFIASASESCDPAEIQLSPEFFRIPHKPLHTVFVFFRFPYFFFRNKRTRYPVSDRPQSFKNYAIIRLVGFAWGNKSCTSFTYPFISVTQLRRRIFTWALRRLMTDPGAALLTNFHHLSTPP